LPKHEPKRELPPEVTSPAPLEITRTLDLKTHERALIVRALERHKGNRQRAAKALNISPVTLWRRMKALKMEDGSA